MDVHLIDGTYELFRHFFAVPSSTDPDGNEIGAVRGVVGSILGMIEEGATHLGVATDHVIESFRNDLFDGYKTGDGVPEDLMSQFGRLEDELSAMGVVVWPMVDQEADDALATAAARAAEDPEVEKVWICTPDKDLAQSVVGTRVVQFDRRKKIERDEAGVREKFGVEPGSIPDYLALVGDAADGIPGIPGWGPRSAAVVLGRFGRIEAIPEKAEEWHVAVRGAERLAETLRERRSDARLYKRLASLRIDTPVFEDIDELRWRAPLPEFEARATRLGVPRFWVRANAVAAERC